MNYAMQISAQGALTSLYRSDVIANNLSNYGTNGYKPDVPVLRQRAVVREEDGVTHLPSNLLLERLGAGPHMAPNRISFSQGPIDTTNNPFDLAIKGDGFFLVAVGEGDNERFRLSRDGRLELDERGRLVQVASGHRVLDSRQRPISISRQGGPVDINADGTIRQTDNIIARISLVDLPDRRGLKREGAGLFVASPEQQQSLQPATGTLVQHAIEQSSVNEISTLNDLNSALGGVGRNISMMTYADQMLDRAINRLGRVA